MFQDFHIGELENYPQRLQKLLDKQREIIRDISQNKSNRYSKILKPLQDLNEELDVFFSPLAHLNSVMNSQQTQKAYEESLPILSKFHSELAQNEKLFAKIKQIKAECNQSQKVIDNEIRDFKLSGIQLPQKEKKRLEEINLKLSELSNIFSQNLLNATNDYELIINNIKDLAGLPKSDIKAAETTKEGSIVYRFTLQAPSYLAYMTYGSNRKYRKELYRAYSTRAPQNSSVIDQILILRKEKAKLLGFSSYAQYALQTRDAKNEDSVIEFLNNLVSTSLSSAKRELDDLKEYALRHDNIDDLEAYDVAYYTEKLKKDKYDLSDADTKPYFEQARVLEGLLNIVAKLFDIRFKSVDVPVWHKCVNCFDIFENNKLSGRIYFDLEARKEKRGGAWMNDWETHFIDSQGNKHLPSAFVVCNFSPSTDSRPSLLRHDDVVTLFHEMGHAIHHLFGKCTERSVSGINGVAWDVVEFPSQFLENFAYEKNILKQIGKHYKTSEPIPDILIEKIKGAKNHMASLGILRQAEFSLFDFTLHQDLYQGENIQKLLDSIRTKTSLIAPPVYNKFQHSFSHIFSGGYAAGYYSYKWAEVLSADAFFECINRFGEFDNQKAKSYKKYILQKGGSEEMRSLYEKWLGHTANITNLLKLYGI